MLAKACPDASLGPSVQILKPKKPLMPAGHTFTARFYSMATKKKQPHKPKIKFL